MTSATTAISSSSSSATLTESEQILEDLVNKNINCSIY
jgi:hypothetical protein